MLSPVRKYWKLLRLVLLSAPRLLFDYFTWILPYSNHPEKVPLEKRYAKGRSLVLHILKHCRFDVHRSGTIVREGVQLYCSNHVSAIDPLLLIALSEKPVSFIAKLEARKLPFAGRFIRAIDGLFLDREDPFQAVKVFRAAKKKMEEESLSYAVFPEGTREKKPYEGKPLPLHPGSFKLAQMAKCPITVYAQFGSFHFSDETKGRRFLITLKELRRYDTADVLALKTTDLAEQTEAMFASALPELIALDRSYFEQGSNKLKAPKWWEPTEGDTPNA